MRICLSAPNTLGYPDGGHVWVFLNWALGFKSLGHEVVWLDVVDTSDTPRRIANLFQVMQERLRPFGLDQSITLCTPEGNPYAFADDLGLVPLEQALACDVLCDHRYNLPAKVVSAFKRTMLIDIDPGQFQLAVQMGTYAPAPHDTYFTVGEWTKFTRTPPFPTLGHTWHYIPPPVALDQWPVTPSPDDAAMTTVSGWFMANEWMPDENGQWYDNSKRAAFQDYLALPAHSPLPLELCLNIGTFQPEIDLLEAQGWRVRKSPTVSHPSDYRTYLQHSRGEFSCAKPAYVRLSTGWLSDRTACYLASGKPVVIQKTGQSDIFPDDLGLLRFTTPEAAALHLKRVSADYPAHSKAARQLAEQYLDAKKVLSRVLEVCI